MKVQYDKTKLSGVELEVFRQWKKLSPSVWNPTNRAQVRVLLSVSGGADSMALARVLIKLKSRLNLKIEAATIHHGIPHDAAGSGKVQARFRDQAEALVVREIAKLDPAIPVHCLRVAEGVSVAQSEAAMRRARRDLLTKISANFDWVAFGHHEDDLLETRLIRMLRGTGIQGLRAMSAATVVDGLPIWRPLLTITAQEIRSYLADAGWKQGREWLEDPSNQEKLILRNRIRHELIPMIERIRVGGVKSLKRSLENLTAHFPAELPSESSVMVDQSNRSLARDELMNLSLAGRRQMLSRWLKEQFVRDYSKAQIDEVLKRLDTRQKRLKFVLCGRVWIVDTQIQLATPSQPFSESSSSPKV
ncbi:MAG: tRNA lysidine(34) synthetase TilS [Deltaproteobacteria bacterium]|nr:tRNA lysidine(34) synthetase TilS [Deltaproteobacteria bacterium]